MRLFLSSRIKIIQEINIYFVTNYFTYLRQKNVILSYIEMFFLIIYKLYLFDNFSKPVLQNKFKIYSSYLILLKC